MGTQTTRGVMVNGRTIGTIQSDPSDSDAVVRRKAWSIPRVAEACVSPDSVVWEIRPFVVKLTMAEA